MAGPEASATPFTRWGRRAENSRTAPRTTARARAKRRVSVARPAPRAPERLLVGSTIFAALALGAGVLDDRAEPIAMSVGRERERAILIFFRPRFGARP